MNLGARIRERHYHVRRLVNTQYKSAAARPEGGRVEGQRLHDLFNAKL